jgi:fimbrial chaperone protein
MVLHMSLPLFAGGDASVKPALLWRLQADGAGGGWLKVQNTGGRHERVSRLDLATPTGVKIAIAPNGSDYILAGASRRWKVAPAAGLKPGSPVAVSLDGASVGLVNATTDGG